MARKFWERVSGNLIRFYDEPQEIDKTVAIERIAELESILATPDAVKALLVQSFPSVTTEDEFNAIFQDEINRLADQIDYEDYSVIQETIDVIDFGWMSPADGALDNAGVIDFCGEEVGNEAANAIVGTTSPNWQHDHNHDGEEDAEGNPAEFHFLVFDFGYPKRIDGIRFHVGTTPGNPLLLAGVQVYVSNNANGVLNNPNSLVGVDLAITGPTADPWAEFDLTPRTGRYVRIEVGSTGHNQNHLTLRDVELRVRARTFGT